MAFPPTIIGFLKSGFEVSASFKISDVRHFFDNGSTNEKSETIYTPVFGPAPFKLGISPCKGNGLGIYLHLPDSNVISRPVSLRFTFTITSYSGQVAYRTLSCDHTFDKSRSYGWHNFLDLSHWDTHESLRSDNGMLIHVCVKSLPVPIPPGPNHSPGVLDVLHKTMRGVQPNVQFKVFDRRSSSGKLSGRRVLFADRRAITEKCALLGQGGSVLFCPGINRISCLERYASHLVLSSQGEEWDVIRVGSSCLDEVETDYLDHDSDFDESDADDNNEDREPSDPNSRTIEDADTATDFSIKHESTLGEIDMQIDNSGMYNSSGLALLTRLCSLYYSRR